jgi:hypothetical protein
MPATESARPRPSTERSKSFWRAPTANADADLAALLAHRVAGHSEHAKQRQEQAGAAEQTEGLCPHALVDQRLPAVLVVGLRLRSARECELRDAAHHAHDLVVGAGVAGPRAVETERATECRLAGPQLVGEDQVDHRDAVPLLLVLRLEQTSPARSSSGPSSADVRSSATSGVPLTATRRSTTPRRRGERHSPVPARPPHDRASRPCGRGLAGLRPVLGAA